MAELMKSGDVNYSKYKYAFLIYSICEIKAELAQKLRSSYKAGDRDYLSVVCRTVLPELNRLYEELYYVHKEQWDSTYKPFGFEVLTFRYGGLRLRVDAVCEKISQYLDNRIEIIEELEENILVNEGGYLQNASCVISPSYSL